MDIIENEITQTDPIDEVPIRVPATIFKKPPDIPQCDSDNRIGVLEADHPLLERFQKSLKEHLLRVKNELTNKISDLNENINRQESERENVGEKLYDIQQQIKKQNTLLDEYSKQIDDTQSKRNEEEKQLVPLKKDFEDKFTWAKEKKRNYNERLLELTRLQVLENNFKNLSNMIDDEVNTAKRTVGKDYQSQQKLTEAKNLSDLLLHNLDTSVRTNELELKNINAQTVEENTLLNSTKTSYANASADLEALQKEHKRLTEAWTEVLIAIQHRDKILQKSKLEYENTKENCKLTDISTESCRKTARKEMGTGERLELFKKRISEDLQNLNTQIIKDSGYLEKLNQKYDNLLSLIESTYEDFTNAKQEGNALAVQLGKIQRKIDKQLQQKMEIEESLLTLAQDRLSTDQASAYRMRVLRNSQEQRRNLEINLSKTEKNTSQTLLDIEKYKGIVIRLKDDNDNLQKTLKEHMDEEDNITQAIKEINNNMIKRSKQLERLTKKLEELLKANEGREMSPTEFKMEELEREIEVNTEEIRQQQEFWVMMQGHVVNITEKRTNAVNNLQIARKQLMIITQKSLRIDREITETEKYGLEILKSLKNLTSRFSYLGSKLFEKQNHHKVSEDDCEFSHIELLEKLKDAEINVLNVERELFEITRKIESDKQMVLEKHREALSWETKYKLIEDTISWLKCEQAVESEIGIMKAEIHRMEIRHYQLKRAQEKLIQDLEHCVSHRDQIFDQAMIQQKLDGKKSRSRTSIQHKLNEIKMKSKASQIEITTNEKIIFEKRQHFEFVTKDISNKQEALNYEREQDLLVMAEIEQGMLLKYQNLENIVKKQQRAKRYRCLSCALTQPKNFKSETMIDVLTEKQKEINYNLSEIVQNLLNEHPSKKFFLTRIAQTLKEN